MKLFDKLDKYFVNNEYKVTIMKSGIHIINYDEIVDFSSTKVVIKYKYGIIIINGSDLAVSKMMDDELFITGKLFSLEYN